MTSRRLAAKLTWHNQAACRGTDIQRWVPDTYDGPVTDEARTVCAGCPVRVTCLMSELSIERNARTAAHGIWGGLTPAERHSILHAEAYGLPAPEIAAALEPGWQPAIVLALAEREEATPVEEPAEQVCTGPCGQVKAIAEFPVRSGTMRRHRQCGACRSQAAATRKSRHRKRQAQAARQAVQCQPEQNTDENAA